MTVGYVDSNFKQRGRRFDEGLGDEAHAFAFPRQESARVMPERLPSMRTEGAGNAGSALHPRPRVQCRKHTR